MSAAPPRSQIEIFRAVTKTAAVWLFIITLAWSPFPLGGAIAWASGVQEVLIAACWFLWWGSSVGQEESPFSGNRFIIIPLILAALTLVWSLIQILPVVPNSWVHPVWNMTSDILGRHLEGTISLNPWRTETEALKLMSYVMACWLVFHIARRSNTAKLLLNAIITIGAFYALYAFILLGFGTQQTKLLYAVPFPIMPPAGPFMLHNSFATYSGLVAVAAAAKLFSEGGSTVTAERGWQRLFASIAQFCFGRGALLLTAFLLCFGGVVLSASRAGFAATMSGLLTLSLIFLFGTKRRKFSVWVAIGTAAAALPLLLLIILNGGDLGSRIAELLASDTGDALRLNFWSATQRMISGAPLLGLGLGTFEDAYPMYATQVFQFVIDKAHCDYLEFAAGVGLPAAIAWWLALVLLVVLCLRGARERRRARHYSIAAVSATVLVAVHSSVDFSLQLPAVALLYATLLGIGVAQCQSSRS